MPKISRGHHSATYEVLELVKVDHDNLALVVRHAAAAEPQRLTLHAARTPAASQLLNALAASLVVSPSSDADSRWTSGKTLEHGLWQAKIMLGRLNELGVTSFDDPSLTVAVLRELYAPFRPSARRGACWLLARAVREHHPDGKRLSYVLKNTRFAKEDYHPQAYDIEIAAGIEKSARRVFADAYIAQRDLFQIMGFEVNGRAWLRMPAMDVIEWATTSHPGIEAARKEPDDRVDEDRKIAWALTHPEWFGYRKHARGPLIQGHQMRRIGRALYPGTTTLVAAAVVHCLAEHAGFNVSVILEKSADSLTYLGHNEALERSIKARGHRKDTRATRLDSLFTAGGVTEAMTGLTRFSRAHRCADDRQHPLDERLYVEHVADPADARILAADRIAHGWRSAPFTRTWADLMGDIERPGLRLSALRLEAQRRTMDLGFTADIHGHAERTKTHYLAHVLPDHAFNDLATQAQDSFHDAAVAKFELVADATDGAAAELAAVDRRAAMDVEIGLCTNSGNAPDTTRRCDLGMVACFTCPNGYRTVDHIPGLLAAVELADIIEAHDPDEWANGQASDLRFYAQACLQAFPKALVAHVAKNTDLTPHILTVTGMYMEMRHG